MLGVVLMLVIVLSGFCYYRVGGEAPVEELTLQPWP